MEIGKGDDVQAIQRTGLFEFGGSAVAPVCIVEIDTFERGVLCYAFKRCKAVFHKVDSCGRAR